MTESVQDEFAKIAGPVLQVVPAFPNAEARAGKTDALKRQRKRCFVGKRHGLGWTGRTNCHVTEALAWRVRALPAE